MRQLYAVALALAMSCVAQFAGAQVYSEDFEDAAYVIGNNPASITGWLTNVGGSGGIEGTNVGLKVVDGAALSSGQTKAVELFDTSDTASFQTYVSSTALQDYNGGNGIEKGTLQFDWTATIGEAQSKMQPCDDRLTDNPWADWDDRDQVLIRMQQNAGGQFYVATSDDSGVAVNSPSITVMAGTTYRILISFDKSDRSISFSMKEGPAFTSEVLAASGKIYSTDPGWKGLRQLLIATGGAPTRAITFDNIIFTDLNAAGPEVAVSVDSVEIANGGTIDCGTPEANVTQETIVIVTNPGTADLTTSDLAVTGEGFAIKSGETLDATITPGNFDEFVIELNSATEEPKSGMLTFTTNDTDESSVSINLTGDVGNTEIEDWQDR